MRERHRIGLDHLQAATTLLQRVRRAHPTAGLYEAADLQWWWRRPRPTDRVPQLHWSDDSGPAAAAITTAWDDRIALAPIALPDATPEWIAHVVARGLAHAAASGFDAVAVEIDRADDGLRALLVDRGFAAAEGGVVETWLAANARPRMSPLPAGYRLAHRADGAAGPHPLVGRSGPDVEARLRQTSLYRPDLDLAVLDARDDVAAYGVFWYDPTTRTGLVEPMRTEEAHQRRGLARHLLTSGVDRLARAGATRIKICFEPENSAARDLYLRVGFAPDRTTAVLSGPTGSAIASTP